MHGVASRNRGCGGSRVKGGVYAELGITKEGGLPLEHFVLCPVRPIDPIQHGLRPNSQVLVEAFANVHWILDWIGAQYYPYPVDWLEEVRRLGMSQRVELSMSQYELIDQHSRIAVVHPLAAIAKKRDQTHACKHMVNMKVAIPVPTYDWSKCPKEAVKQDAHESGNWELCAGHMWMTLPRDDKEERHARGKSKAYKDITSQMARHVVRKMPGFEYSAIHAMKDYSFVPAIFGAFPIQRWAIVRDHDGKRHEDKLNKLANSTLHVEVVDE